MIRLSVEGVSKRERGVSGGAREGVGRWDEMGWPGMTGVVWMVWTLTRGCAAGCKIGKTVRY